MIIVILMISSNQQIWNSIIVLISFSEEPHWRISQRVTCAILAPISGTESEILSRRTYQSPGIWQFYKHRWLMRISEIFLLENLSINVPYHRLTKFVWIFIPVIYHAFNILIAKAIHSRDNFIKLEHRK